MSSDSVTDYFELRLYNAVPGRIPDLNQRMHLEVPRLFKKNGVVRPVAYWEGYAGPMTPLYAYMLRWKSLDARMRAFSSFYADREWHEMQLQGNAGKRTNERIHVQFLKGVKEWQQFIDPSSVGEVQGLHELTFLEATPENLAEATAWVAESRLRFQQDEGAIVLGLFNTCIGARTCQVVSLVAWPTETSRGRVLDAVKSDSMGTKAVGGGTSVPLLRAGPRYLLRPTRYGVAQFNLASLPVEEFWPEIEQHGIARLSTF